MSSKLFTVNNKADHAEILITGQIGGSFWDDSGMTEKAFLEAINSIPKDKPLTIGINSEGGSIQDGLGIYNAIKRHAGPTTARIDGYAVSIASVIPLAADKVQSAQSSIWMIHDPWMMAQGNADEMRKAAETLDKHAEVLAAIYTEETGMPTEDIRRMMAAETWFRGDEAVVFGFADESTEAAVALNSFDATRFKNVPKDVLAKSISTEPAVVAEEVVSVKPAATNGDKKAKNMSEPIAPVAADKSAEILAKIEALENKLNAPAPVPQARIEVIGNPAVEHYNSLLPGKARADFRKVNHMTLMKERSKVQNSNTIDSALIPDYMSDALITITTNKLAMLNAFSLGVGLNPMAPRSTVQVKLASAGSTTLTNATDFEQGGSTLAGQPVTVNQLTQPFNLTNAEVNQGIVINNLAEVNADALANAISDVVTALMVSGSYSAATAVGAASAFTPTGGKLSIIYGVAKNFRQKNLIMDGGHLGYLIPTDKFSFKLGESGAFGFDMIAENNRWTSAETNTVGFVCSKDAICIATGTPLNLPSSEFLSQTTAQLSSGLSVVLSSWYSRASRNIWMSYDLMFGAGVGDSTAGEILVTS